MGAWPQIGIVLERSRISAFSLENVPLSGGVNLLAPHGVPSPLAWQGALSFKFSLFSVLLVDGPSRS